MKESAAKTIYLKDYAHTPFLIETTQLSFDLYDEYADVFYVLHFTSNNEAKGSDSLVLQGQDLTL